MKNHSLTCFKQQTNVTFALQYKDVSSSNNEPLIECRIYKRAMLKNPQYLVSLF